MNTRQKPTITTAKYPSLKAVFSQKLKTKMDSTKIQTVKINLEKTSNPNLQRKSSTAKIDERAFKEMSRNKVQNPGLSIREAVELETREMIKRSHNTRQSMEKSFYMGSQINRPPIQTQREDKPNLKLIQKRSPKIKKLIAQGIVTKNIIPKQIQQTVVNLHGPSLKTIINPKITQRKIGNGNPNSQNINTINLNNNPTKSKNDIRQNSRNSNRNKNKNLDQSGFINDRENSSITILQSKQAKVIIANMDSKINNPSSSINMNLNLQNKKVKQQLIESFDYDLDRSYEIKNLNCEEAIIKNRYNLKTDIDRREIESEEDIDIESEEESIEKKNFYKPKAFKNKYDNETINYLIQQEELYRIKPNYLDKCQNNITWTMRMILLDWMQEVCSDYLFKRETFHYAVNYVDRYLALVHHIEVKSLQLIGLGALFLAAKMEEVYTPKIDNIVTAANNSYSQSQVRSVEYKIYEVSL